MENQSVHVAKEQSEDGILKVSPWSKDDAPITIMNVRMRPIVANFFFLSTILYQVKTSNPQFKTFSMRTFAPFSSSYLIRMNKPSAEK
jgi:hypothetical protein